jgi:electron transfer flavoprotein alpha subunit
VDQLVDLPRREEEVGPDQLAADLADGMTHFGLSSLLTLANGTGRELLPRTAALLDAPLVMNCLDVDLDRGLARTNRYGGKVVATLSVQGPRRLFGLLPHQVVPRPAAQPGRCHLNSWPGTGSAPVAGLELVRRVASNDEGPALTEAEVVIAGGRGAGDEGGIQRLRDCAHQLGAAFGASRAAVDAGWVSYAHQVGQTGTVVSPKVYVACGISGSVQHLAGMKTSGLVIAVNTDPTVPFRSHCDYFVEADHHELLPRVAAHRHGKRA